MYHDSADITQAVVFPNLMVKIIVKEQGVGMSGHILKEGILNGREDHFRAVLQDLMMNGINGKLFKFPEALSAGGVGVITLDPADIGLDASEELTIVDGLDHIVIAAVF